MPLGTLDRTPPPFFRQGPSALTKLVFFSALAVFLMVADARFRMVAPLAVDVAAPESRYELVTRSRRELAPVAAAFVELLAATAAGRLRRSRR